MQAQAFQNKQFNQPNVYASPRLTSTWLILDHPREPALFRAATTKGSPQAAMEVGNPVSNKAIQRKTKKNCHRERPTKKQHKQKTTMTNIQHKNIAASFPGYHKTTERPAKTILLKTFLNRHRNRLNSLEGLKRRQGTTSLGLKGSNLLLARPAEFLFSALGVVQHPLLNRHALFLLR